MDFKELQEKLKQPIKVKNPYEDFRINFICSDGKTFIGDDEGAKAHNMLLFKRRVYYNLSWFRRLFTKKP